MTITNTLYLVIIPTWQFPPDNSLQESPGEQETTRTRKEKPAGEKKKAFEQDPGTCLDHQDYQVCQVANFWRKGPGCPLCTVYPNSIQAYLRGTYHAFSHRGIHANLHADMHTRYCASLNRLFCSSQGFVCFVLFLFSFPFSKYQQLPGYIYMAGAHFKNSSLPLSVSRAR